MRHFWIGVAVISLVAGICFALAEHKRGSVREAGGGDSALVKHGDYLVTSVALCGACHTPHDNKGRPDSTRLLQGATVPIKPIKSSTNWMDTAPDITRSGLAGKWSEADMIKFLTTGTDTAGMHAVAPMPAFRMSREDARAVTLYLQSLPGKKKQ